MDSLPAVHAQHCRQHPCLVSETGQKTYDVVPACGGRRLRRVGRQVGAVVELGERQEGGVEVVGSQGEDHVHAVVAEDVVEVVDDVTRGALWVDRAGDAEMRRSGWVFGFFKVRGQGQSVLDVVESGDGVSCCLSELRQEVLVVAGFGDQDSDM